MWKFGNSVFGICFLRLSSNLWIQARYFCGRAKFTSVNSVPNTCVCFPWFQFLSLGCCRSLVTFYWGRDNLVEQAKKDKNKVVDDSSELETQPAQIDTAPTEKPDDKKKSTAAKSKVAMPPPSGTPVKRRKKTS